MKSYLISLTLLIEHIKYSKPGTPWEAQSTLNNSSVSDKGGTVQWWVRLSDLSDLPGPVQFCLCYFLVLRGGNDWQKGKLMRMGAR